MMIIRWILWVDNAISVLFSPPFCEVDHLAIWQNTQISRNLHCLYPTDVEKGHVIFLVECGIPKVMFVGRTTQKL